MSWDDLQREGRALAERQRRIDLERARLDAEERFFLYVIGPILIAVAGVAAFWPL